MTTSNPGITGVSAGDAQATPAAFGLPDAAVIAQLANALFNALPGRPTVPAFAADAQAAPPTSALPLAPPAAPEGEFASLPVAPYVSPTSGFSPASDAELRAAPASLASVGGVAPPATAATPPDAALPYFLEPAQPGLPGTAVGIGPSAVTRVESGAMPTAPSPPSAFAQPAEPKPREAAALLSASTGFRPTLEAAPIPAATTPTATAADAQTASLPLDSHSAKPLTPVIAAPPFYFLGDAPASPLTTEPSLPLDAFSFPALLDLALDGLALDSRGLDAGKASATPASPQPPTTPAHYARESSFDTAAGLPDSHWGGYA